MTSIDEWCKEITRQIDEAVFAFLNDNGYKIEKPYTREKAEEIAEQLKKEGKRLTYKVELDRVIFNREMDNYEVITKISCKIERISDNER